jgi:hypothetical protein
MNRRTRNPAPEFTPAALYVAAPVRVLDWLCRHLILHVPVIGTCSELPRTTKWRVCTVRNAPEQLVVLEGDPCEHCGALPRCRIEAAHLRNPKIAGWLPQ